MDRDQQPSSPWRQEDDDALTASGHWPTATDAARARSGLAAVKRTLASARPPAPKPRHDARDKRERRTG